jgi:RNA polymerase sigma-70 factor (ECF subfamily)
MSKTDRELMLAFQQSGRESVFAKLVDRYKVPLINYFYRLTWDRQASEDCCQEVFCRIFRHRKNYVPSAKFATYIYRIARNLWIDRYRSLKAAPRPLSLDTPLSDTGDTMGDLVESSSTEEPDHHIETYDEFRRVQQALDTLSPDLRETLLLVKYQGLKYSEAAGVLAVPVGTVRSRIHAALGQVRSILDVAPPEKAREKEKG